MKKPLTKTDLKKAIDEGYIAFSDENVVKCPYNDRACRGAWWGGFICAKETYLLGGEYQEWVNALPWNKKTKNPSLFGEVEA